jgi:hypothetical protein
LLPTERLYVLSLGSQQANRHVHWHLAPLPPGVPYEQQQTALFAPELGTLDIPDATWPTWPAAWANTWLTDRTGFRG